LTKIEGSRITELDRHVPDPYHAMHEVANRDDGGTPEAILHVGPASTLFPQTCGMDGVVADSGVGPARRPKWKKRARTVSNSSGSSQLPPAVPSMDKKRSFDQIKDAGVGLITAQSKKSRTLSGVVSSNDPLSVEAVGQPCRLQ
jgi:hypothetical protein